eukprot:COSAG01_NODE_4033_length_5415_cov_22.663093_2_plen_1105_part_01
MASIKAEGRREVWASQNTNGRTLLHMLCGNPSVSTEALVAGSEAAGGEEAWAVQDTAGVTPLYILCGIRSVSKETLMAGVKAAGREKAWTVQNTNGWTPLHMLCMSMSKETLMSGIKAAGSEEAWGVQNEEGRTPLSILCNNPSVSTEALMASSEVAGGEKAWAVQDKKGETPVHTLCNNPSVSKETLMAGIKAAGGEKVWTMQSTAKWTPLHRLCMNISMSKEALMVGIKAAGRREMWTVQNTFGCTPLHELCGNPSVSTEALVTSSEAVGGEEAWIVRDNDGRTPVHMLCNNPSVSTEALVAGSEAAGGEEAWIVRDKDGRTPVHMLCKNPSVTAKVFLGAMRRLIEDKFLAVDILKRVRLLVGFDMQCQHDHLSTELLDLVAKHAGPSLLHNSTNSAPPLLLSLLQRYQPPDTAGKQLPSVDPNSNQPLAWLRHVSLWRSFVRRGPKVVVVKQIRGEPMDMVGPTNTVIFQGWSTVGAPDAVITTGKVYYEIIVHKVGSCPQFGWCAPAFDASINIYNEDGVGDDTYSWGVDGARNRKYHDGFTDDGFTEYDVAWNDGDTIGFAANLDTGELQFSKNGTWEAQSFNGVRPDGGLYPAISAERGTVALCNFGQQSWRFAPPDESYVSVSAQAFATEPERLPAPDACKTKYADLTPLHIATGAKLRAWVEAMVQTLCSDVCGIVHGMPGLMGELRALFEAGFGAQAVQLMRDSGVHVVPSNGAQIPDLDPVAASAAWGGSTSEECVTAHTFEQFGGAWDANCHGVGTRVYIYAGRRATGSYNHTNAVGYFGKVTSEIQHHIETQRAPYRLLNVELHDGTRLKCLDSTSVNTLMDGAWLDRMGNQKFEQTKLRRWWHLRLLPMPRSSKVAAEPVMVAIEGAANAGSKGLLAMVVKYTTDGKHMDVFSTELVSSLIDFKWNKYGQARFLYETAAHATLLSAWTYITILDVSTPGPIFGSLGTAEAAMTATLCMVAGIGVDAANFLYKTRWWLVAMAMAATMTCIAGALLYTCADVGWAAAGAMILVLSLGTRSLSQEVKQLVGAVPTAERFDRDFPQPSNTAHHPASAVAATFHPRAYCARACRCTRGRGSEQYEKPGGGVVNTVP